MTTLRLRTPKPLTPEVATEYLARVATPMQLGAALIGRDPNQFVRPFIDEG
jgi:hypothetical protein